MSHRRNKEAVEAWKAAQPQYERRAKRRLLHRAAKRIVVHAYGRYYRSSMARMWRSIWDSLWSEPFVIPESSDYTARPRITPPSSYM